MWRLPTKFKPWEERKEKEKEEKRIMVRTKSWVWCIVTALMLWDAFFSSHLKSAWLSYCCFLPALLNQSGHSPPTTNINKAFLPLDLLHTLFCLSYHFVLFKRLLCVKIPWAQQFLKYLNLHGWHSQPCRDQNPCDHISPILMFDVSIIWHTRSTFYLLQCSYVIGWLHVCHLSFRISV